MKEKKTTQSCNSKMNLKQLMQTIGCESLSYPKCNCIDLVCLLIFFKSLKKHIIVVRMAAKMDVDAVYLHS